MMILYFHGDSWSEFTSFLIYKMGLINLISVLWDYVR